MKSKRLILLSFSEEIVQSSRYLIFSADLLPSTLEMSPTFVWTTSPSALQWQLRASCSSLALVATNIVTLVLLFSWQFMMYIHLDPHVCGTHVKFFNAVHLCKDQRATEVILVGATGRHMIKPFVTVANPLSYIGSCNSVIS